MLSSKSCVHIAFAGCVIRCNLFSRFSGNNVFLPSISFFLVVSANLHSSESIIASCSFVTDRNLRFWLGITIFMSTTWYIKNLLNYLSSNRGGLASRAIGLGPEGPPQLGPPWAPSVLEKILFR